ncbi:MAG: hypothetical protein C0490_11815 [Marivirga sp.]|nr:hypothetical protein [Marivirga sp.]
MDINFIGRLPDKQRYSFIVKPAGKYDGRLRLIPDGISTQNVAVSYDLSCTFRHHFENKNYDKVY